MATGNIALSNTINVSLSNTPAGLGDYNTNSIVLLSNEQPISSEPYIWAVSAQDVINEYGSNSLTAKMASALFTPAFNLRTGNGQLLVFPYTATNATNGNVTTAEITENQINYFKTVQDGILTVSLDGVEYTLKNLNFKSILNISDIVQVLNAWGLDCDIEATADGKIKFISRNLGGDSIIELLSSGDRAIITYTSETITGATVNAETFGTEVSSVSGTYDFTYSSSNWVLNSQTVTLADYGIAIDGTATEGDKLKVVYTASVTDGTDIYGTDYLNGASATSVQGQDAEGTTIAEAMAQVDEITYVGGVLTTQYCENNLVIANATALQGKDHIYYEATKSLKNISNLGAAIKSANLFKTRLVAYSGVSGAKQAIATYATIASSTNYSGDSTCLTMNLKTLTGIQPDLNLNQTYYNIAKQYGVDIFANTEGLSVVYSFDNGLYTDEATGELWLKKALEVSGFNYLRKTNTKIPQTESAMTGLKNAYEQRLMQGIRNGLAAPGTWNDSIPFGNPEDFLRNIEERGYYIYSLPISQQPQTEREARIAPVVQIAVKLSGAFHSSNVIVNVQR